MGVMGTIEKGFGRVNSTVFRHSFGVANPGAITLRNHPKALSNHVRLTGDRVDLGTIDILRDRERGVPRYNDFRLKLRKKRITRFEDLSDDPELNEEIRDVYSPDVYTPEGLRWVEESDMKDVFLRHHPELEPALDRVENAFAPWNRLGT